MTSFLENKILIYVIPFFLGLVTSYSLPPFSFVFINFITFPILLILLVSNYQKGRWTSFNIGWMFGFGYFISNIYWITNALTFEEIFKPLIPISFILIPLFLGIFYGLITLICSFFNLRKNISSILIFSFFFSLIEFIRGFIFGGFPWNLIAYSWSDYLEFLQILSFTGTYTLNLLSITIFLIPTIIFFNFRLITKILTLIFATILIITNFFYGILTIEKNKKVDETNLNFIIKIISPKIEIDRFFQNESPEKTILDFSKIKRAK